MDFKHKKSLSSAPISPYAIASIVGISTLVPEVLLFPLESIRLRLQVNGRYGFPAYASIRDCVSQTVNKSGVVGLYKGLGVTLLREAAFMVPKLYTYEQIKRYFAADVNKVGYYRKVCPILGASAFGLVVCNVFDILRIKYITSLGVKPIQSVQGMLKDILNKHGSSTLFKGFTLNLMRTTAFISAELAAYQQTRLLLINKLSWKQNSIALHVVSGITAGVLACVAACPLDVLRTRFMSQIGEQNGFKSASQCALDIIRNDSLRSFYRGFVPLVLKSIPSSLLFFTIAENLKTTYLKSMHVENSLYINRRML